MRDHCAAAGVPFHFKQWGEWQDGSSLHRRNVLHAAVLSNGMYCAPDGREARIKLDRESGLKWNQLEAVCMSKVGVKEAGRLLDGVSHDAFPEVRYA